MTRIYLNYKFILLSLFLAALLPLAARSQTVVINEIGGNNVSSVPNGTDFPDWVELYNASGSQVNLGGWSLTDDTNSPAKWKFPSNLLLNAGSYLVVWCDSTNSAPGFHTGFNLKNEGEMVALYNSASVRQDFVLFGIQLPDQSIGRVPNGTGRFTLNTPTPALPNVAALLSTNVGTLRLNEWMATNSAGPNEDWLELYNPDPLPVDLAGLIFSGKTNVPTTSKAMVPLCFIPGSGYIKFTCDNPSPYFSKGADHLDFKLSSTSGETNTLFGTNGITIIDRITFGPQVRDMSEGRLPDGSTNIVRPLTKDTPGASNFLPLTNVVINEILTHTDLPLEDAIELYNPTTAPMDISNWWLSNSKDDAKKFRIPTNTIIQPNGYKVFYEYAGQLGGFNPNGQGTNRSFTFNSAHGDEAYLYTADANGTLTGYRQSISFGSSENGVSFGRYVASDGHVDITAMETLTFGTSVTANAPPSYLAIFRTGTGATNTYPKIGPIVINEIMFKPPNFQLTNDNSIDEYIELHNIYGTNVPLYHVEDLTNSWKLDDAVTYTFPPFALMKPYGYLLVVNFNPVTNLTQLAAFKSTYGIPAGFTNFYGPYGGKLKNSGGNVKLYKPDKVQAPPHPDAGFVPFILVDRVEYSDSAPWPTASDGHGSSLQRRNRNLYGNDAANWFAEGPTPGRTNAFVGTLLADSITPGVGGSRNIYFTAIQGQSYTVQYRDLVDSGPWTGLTNIPAQTVNGQVIATDYTPSSSTRFYRIATPALP